MSSESPVIELYSSDGYELSVQNNTITPTGTRGLLVAGSDGTTTRFILMDGSSRQIVAGAGVAGTPAGGVLTIQGVSGGTVVPVSGTVTANQGTSPWVVNTTQFGGNNVVTGTGVSGVGIPRVTVSNDSNILATQSGTWTATVTQATAANLNATVVGTTAAGSGASTGLVTIQGNAGGTPVPVTGTLTTSTDGYATTAAPVYTNNTFNPLSLTTVGALRVDGSAVTQPVSGTVTANQGGTWTATVTQATAANLNATVTANGNFNNASVGATATAPPADATYVGGLVTTAVESGLTNNDMYPLSMTTTGLLRVDGSNVTQPVSGTVTANQGGTWTVQPGNTANTTPWLATINQGGNSATVKAASTAAVATDSALVVAISPNNPIVSNADGYATTVAPAYTNNTFNPLSLTTAGALRVDGSAVTQPVSGTVTANAGTGTFTVGQAAAANLNATVVGTGSDNTTNSTAKLPVLPARANTSAPSFTDGNMVPLSTDTSGNLRVTINKSSTSTITSVASSTSSTSILASNTNRILATVYNGANKTMYLALASTASTSSYTIQMDTNSYFELPADYTGAISAVWANGVSGNALVTELT
jgi:trimeric autotransporter adhesin